MDMLKMKTKGIEISNISDEKMRLAFGRLVEYLEPNETKEYRFNESKDQDSFIRVARVVVPNHLSAYLVLNELEDAPKQEKVTA